MDQGAFEGSEVQSGSGFVQRDESLISCSDFDLLSRNIWAIVESSEIELSDLVGLEHGFSSFCSWDKGNASLFSGER